MSQLDIIKETVAYLKFWLAIMVVSDISLVGWLLSNAEKAPDFKIYGTTVGIVIIAVSAVFAHKRIEHFISTLTDI